MDKYEYKVRADEIKALIAEGNYIQAADIADTIDWRRVKSVLMLCTVSDLYKINRRYEDAKNMLLLAYERRPGGRTICYSLCELCIKTEEFVQALNFYKEFVKASPKDPSRYVLQYKLYEAQDVSLEERIGVLEELKKRDYREKWAYELAFLYHRVGLATRCVEECDEMILWFGEGKYVVKAMELKMLHQPLTPAQQDMYDHRFDKDENPGLDDDDRQEEEIPEEPRQAVEPPAAEPQPESGQASAGSDVEPLSAQQEEIDIQVKTVDVGKFNTINLQAELAAGLQEVLGTDDITRSIVAPMMETDAGIQIGQEKEPPYAAGQDVEAMEETEVFFGETGEMTGMPEETQEDDTVADIVQPEEDTVQPNPVQSESVQLNLVQSESVQPNPVQLESAQLNRVQSESAQPNPVQSESVQLNPIQLEPVHSNPVQPGSVQVDSAQEVFARTDAVQNDKAQVTPAAGDMGQTEVGPTASGQADTRQEQEAEQAQSAKGQESGSSAVPSFAVQPPRELADVLSQEADGQISLVMPETVVVEKQLTGQMKIEDVLAEWARMKKEREERCREEVRQRVLRETGPMFTEFEAAIRDGLLEQLENGTAPEDIATVLPVEEPLKERSAANGDPVLEPDGDEAADPEESAENGEELFEEPEDYEEEQEELTAGLEYIEDEGEQPDRLGYIEDGDTLEGQEYSGETGAAESPQEVLEEEYETSAEPEKEENPEDEVQDSGGLEAENSGKECKSDEEPSPEEKLEQKVYYEPAKIRGLTREEKELYAPFIQSRNSREQLVKAIDNISMAAYTGNIIITGEEGMDTISLARNMIREVRMTDNNFSGKVAKVTGQGLNDRNIGETLEKLNNGALIIQKASGMSGATAEELYKQLQQERLGIIVVLEDTRKSVNKLLSKNPNLAGSFTARIDLEALSNDTLVSFGRLYAREREYSIDDLGVLALHTRIEELQTIDHVVTVIEVKGIVDEAISRASRKTIGHFFDILFAKRYDNEDMIILTEKDFVA